VDEVRADLKSVIAGNTESGS